MVKQQQRARSRKVNFKSRLAVHVGLAENQFDPVFEHSTKRKDADSDDEKVETGVDKDEEGEVHLQNFIQSSAAALLGRSGGARASQSAKAAAAFIPTPDATGTAEDYDRFYPQNVFTEPATFIRYSDTVEDLFPIAYLMDEDDSEWLQQHNADATASSPEGKGRKSKGKEPARAPLSEDDFEAIMDAFEKLCDDLVPFLHLDLTRIPTLDQLISVFDSSRLAGLKAHAKAIHPHWKRRRTDRGGKPIMPQLDHDETREDNPYVCFRRREAKNVRKTRRTDAQNVERLVRLRVDLSTALELLQQVAQRERVKRETVDVEAGVFEARVKLREAKRAAGEKDGDDDLLIAKKERKRRRLEDLQPQILPLGAHSQPGYRLPLKLPRAEVLAAQAQPQPPILAEPLIPFRDRTGQVSARMDHDMQKKRESDREWEDWTDGAFLPMPLSTPARHWRTPDAVNVFSADGSKETLYAFGTHHAMAIGGARPAYRKRFGRGGRVILDRVLPRSRTPRMDDPEMAARLSSQWRYDSDAALELPAHDDDSVLDDYSLQYMAARISLIADELPQLAPSSAWCQQVANPWLVRESEMPPPNIIIGKLPTRPPPPQQQQSAAAMAMQAQNGMHSTQAQLAYAAAQARQQQQQQQAGKPMQQNANAIGNGTPQAMPPMRRADSVNGVQMPAQWANGAPNMQNVQLLQQMQNAAMQNAAAHRQNGSPVLPNGLPRVPPFASPAQQHSLPNGVHAPRPPSAASNGGSPSMMNALLASPHNGPVAMQSPAHAPVSLPSPQNSPASAAPAQTKKRAAPNLQLGSLPAFSPYASTG